MSEKKRIRIAWIYLSLVILLELIKIIWHPEGWFEGFSLGVELVLILGAIGYSAKFVGVMSAEKKLRIQSFVILTISTVLAVYLFIL